MAKSMHIKMDGKRFGKWTVVNRTDRKKVVYYFCRCDCGTERSVLSVSLRNGKSVSCGCYQPEKWRQGIRRVHRTTYNSWAGMRQRCNYPKHTEYHRYGGRGITYDSRWKDFSVFLADMGPRPPGTSIDRIDNNGNYCKDNCRWATPEDQISNTVKTVRVEWKGRTLSLKQLAKHLGVNYDTLHKFHRTKGLPIQEAVELASA
jgi:hypothetical protein